MYGRISRLFGRLLLLFDERRPFDDNDLPRKSSQGSERLHAKMRELFAIDPRSLLLARVCVALFVLVDILQRFSDLRLHYTGAADSMLVDEVAATWWQNSLGPTTHASDEWSQYSLCFHRINRTVLFQTCLFLVQAALAVGLLIGVRVRLCAAMSWLFLLSLHNYNPLVLDDGDHLLRTILFWMMMLPLHHSASVDGAVQQRLAGVRGLPVWRSHVESVVCVALLVNVALVYEFSAASKTNVDWLDGSALHRELHAAADNNQWVASWLLLRPSWTPALSHTFTHFEIVAPMLYFVPVCTSALRLFACLAFLLYHAALSLCVSDAPPFLLMVGMHAFFLPCTFWNAASTMLTSADRCSMKLLYDKANAGTEIMLALAYAVVPMCVDALPILPKSSWDHVHDEDGRMIERHPYASFPNFGAQLVATASLDEMRRRESSICAVSPTGREVWFSYSGFLHVLRAMPFVSSIEWLLRRSVCRASLLWIGARLRGVGNAWERHERVRLAAPQIWIDANRRSRLDLWRRRVLRTLVFAALLFSLNWNLSTLLMAPVSARLRFVAPLLRLDQQWHLAPSGDSAGSIVWLSMPGTLRNGSVYELFDGGPPRVPSTLYSLENSTVLPPHRPRWQNDRWRILLDRGASSPSLLQRYGDAVCAAWNERGPGAASDESMQLATIAMARVLYERPALAVHASTDTADEAAKRAAARSSMAKHELYNHKCVTPQKREEIAREAAVVAIKRQHAALRFGCQETIEFRFTRFRERLVDVPKLAGKNMYSGISVGCGLRFRAVLYPYGLDAEHKDVAVFVDMRPELHDRPDLAVNVQFMIRMLNYVRPSRSSSRQDPTPRLFSRRTADWGFPGLVRLERLLNDDEGWLHDDTVTVEATVTLHEKNVDN